MVELLVVSVHHHPLHPFLRAASLSVFGSLLVAPYAGSEDTCG